MDQNNELNDIILNKGNGANSNKKIILAVATLGVILIIVVMLMNSLSSNNNENLPQAVLPPQPQTKAVVDTTDEPLFEEIDVVEEDTNNDSNLDQIAQKLKEESFQEKEASIEAIEEVETPVVKASQKNDIKIVTPKKSSSSKVVATGKYYVQVGSFSKYEPNKQFLKSITDLGFNYKYHNIVKNSKSLNKVLVGPFKSEIEAKDARRVLRAKVEPGSFLVQL
jgi:DedD protein